MAYAGHLGYEALVDIQVYRFQSVRVKESSDPRKLAYEALATLEVQVRSCSNTVPIVTGDVRSSNIEYLKERTSAIW
jgi:hypothetical protein